MVRRVLMVWFIVILVAGSSPAALAQDAPPGEPASAEETAPAAGDAEAEVPQVAVEPAQTVPAGAPPADPPEDTPATGEDTTVPPTPTPTATLAVALPVNDSADATVTPTATMTPTATSTPDTATFTVQNTMRLCPWVEGKIYLRHDRASLERDCPISPTPVTLTATGDYSGSHTGFSWKVTTTLGATFTLTETVGLDYTYPTIWCRHNRSNEEFRQSNGFGITFTAAESAYWLCNWYNFERQPGEFTLSLYHHVCPWSASPPNWDRDTEDVIQECDTQEQGEFDASFSLLRDDRGVIHQAPGDIISRAVPVGSVMVRIDSLAHFAEPLNVYSNLVCSSNDAGAFTGYSGIGDDTFQVNGDAGDIITCHWFHVAAPNHPDAGTQGDADSGSDPILDLPAMTFFVNLTAYLCPSDATVDYMSMTVEELLAACTLDPRPLDFTPSGGYDRPHAGTSWAFSADAPTTITEANWRGYGTPIVACGQPGVPPTIEHPEDRTITVSAPPYGTVLCDWFDIAVSTGDSDRFEHDHVTHVCPSTGDPYAMGLSFEALLDTCDAEPQAEEGFAFVTSFGDGESHRDNSHRGSFANPSGEVGIEQLLPDDFASLAVYCDAGDGNGPQPMDAVASRITLHGAPGGSAGCHWFVMPQGENEQGFIPFTLEFHDCTFPLLPELDEIAQYTWRCEQTTRTVSVRIGLPGDGNPPTLSVENGLLELELLTGTDVSFTEIDSPDGVEQHAVGCWTDLTEGGQERTGFTYLSPGEPFGVTVEPAVAAGCMWLDIRVTAQDAGTAIPPADSVPPSTPTYDATPSSTPTTDTTLPSTPIATPTSTVDQPEAPTGDATPPSTPVADDPVLHTISVTVHTCPSGVATDLAPSAYLTECEAAGEGLGFRLSHAAGASLGETDASGFVSWTGIPGGPASIQHHRPLDIQDTVVTCAESGGTLLASGGYWQVDLVASTPYYHCDLYNIPGGTASVTVHTRVCPPHTRAELTDVCAIGTNGIAFSLEGPSGPRASSTGDAGDGMAHFTDLTPGTYTIVESVPAGISDVYVLECTGQSTGSIRPTPLSTTESLSITIAAVDAVDCTWVNVAVRDPSMGDLVVVAMHCWTTEFVSDIDCEIDERGVGFDLLRWDDAWTHLGSSTTDAYGTVAWRGIPPAAYWVDPQGAAWCHIDSGQLSADGASLDVTGGQETVVTIYTCADDAQSYGKPPATTPTKYPNTGVPPQQDDGAALPGVVAVGAGALLSRRRLLCMSGAVLLGGRATLVSIAAQDLGASVEATPESLCLDGAPDPESGAPCTRGAVPAHVRIPAIDVDAPVEVLEVVAGEMQQPTDEVHVAWYKESARLGESGNMHLAGHLNWWGVPEAVFFALDTLRGGDEVIVLDEDGEEFLYTVEWVRQESNLEPPSDDALGMTPYQAVTLITCSGAWNTDINEYDRRTVVRARRSISG